MRPPTISTAIRDPTMETGMARPIVTSARTKWAHHWNPPPTCRLSVEPQGVDFDGGPRPVGGYDIGADEIALRCYLPLLMMGYTM